MKIKVSFFFLLMLASLLLSHAYLSLAAFISAAIHELGHILAARKCSISLGEMRLGIFGAQITPKTSLCSYKNEILLAIAGPLANLLTATLLLLLCNESEGFWGMLFQTSLFLGILNLLPIDDFDGGRILRCSLLLFFSPQRVSSILQVISFILVLSLWIFSVYLLLRASASLSLFTFSLSLFCKTFLKQKI